VPAVIVGLFVQFRREPKSGEVLGLFGVFDGTTESSHIMFSRISTIAEQVMEVPMLRST
jgi:hypothetical protein